MDLKPSLLTLALAACACGGPQDDAPEPALPSFDAQSTDAVQSERVLSPLEARRDYLTQWSRCLMRTGSQLERSWARLEQDIDVDKLRVRAKGIKPFFDAVDGELLDACPLGTPPPADVAPTIATRGRAYVLATRGYGNRAKELRQYFDTEGYVTDAWAQLKDDLPAQKDAYDAAHAAEQAFAAELEGAQDAADGLWLDALAANGGAQSAAWHVTNTALHGRATRHCVSEQRPLPEACTDAHEAFTAARDGLLQWQRAHQADAVGVFWLDVFGKRAEALEEALAGLSAPLSRRKKTAEAELAAAAARVAEARAALQMAANTVVFDFP
ncbi:MAG: hypothetical protein ACE37F_37850 [Nannocystaceae bacterium]|nr:DUF3829 domain-containing protein [bacterium]